MLKNFNFKKNPAGISLVLAKSSDVKIKNRFVPFEKIAGAWTNAPITREPSKKSLHRLAAAVLTFCGARVRCVCAPVGGGWRCRMALYHWSHANWVCKRTLWNYRVTVRGSHLVGQIPIFGWKKTYFRSVTYFPVVVGPESCLWSRQTWVKQVNDVRFVLMAHLGEARHSSGEVQETGLTIFQNTSLNLRSLLHAQNGLLPCQ